jgi:tetratricopeptide (TPR) repeat protein
LSGAFLNPKDGEHLMFAYYESYLFVDFLIRKHGMESLQKILKDLGDGILINDAIVRQTKPFEELELAFAEEVQGIARNLGPGVDWAEPDPQKVDLQAPAAVEAYTNSHPDNFKARQIHTGNLLSAERWREAAESALWLIELLPDYTDADNGYSMKAAAHRAMGQPKEEAAALRELARRSPEALNSYLRLIELDLKAGNWQALLLHSSQAIAINPFLEQAHWARGRAWEGLNENEKAVASYQRMLDLNPVNPAEVNLRLAHTLQPSNPLQAKRHVLDALADAPRYRDARKLLLGMAQTEKAPGSAKPGSAPAPAEDPLAQPAPPDKR